MKINILRKAMIFVTIAALMSVVVILQISLDYKAASRSEYHEKVLYLPTAKYAKVISAGFQNVIADYLYLWSIQFFYEKQDVGRFQHIEKVFDVVTELDPKYVESYRIGATMMIKDVYKRHQNPKGKEMAFALLDKGIKNNPSSWILPFEAANAAHFDFNDPELANKYYEMALNAPDLPHYYKRRISTAIGATLEGFNKQDALRYWFELWQTAELEITRNIAYSHFYDLKIELDIEYLTKAIEIFAKRYGTKPGRLSELIRGGVLRALPLDPNGLPYLYDITTGDVRPPKGTLLKKKSGTLTN